MARDGLVNVVDELHSRGFDPRRVGRDAWEARCPVHKGPEHALAITRNEHNHVILECRGPQNCQYARIIAALGLTNAGVYKETYDFTIRRLSRIPIRPASFNRAGVTEIGGVISGVPEAAKGLATSTQSPAGNADADAIASPVLAESRVRRWVSSRIRRKAEFQRIAAIQRPAYQSATKSPIQRNLP
jgi:hypothetical protein